MRPFLLLVFTLMSFAHATTFRFEPRISLPPDMHERRLAACLSDLTALETLGEQIRAVAQATIYTSCYESSNTSSEAVTRYFTRTLSALEYIGVSQNSRPPLLYSAKWTAPERSARVVSSLSLQGTDSALTFIFVNDGDITRAEAAEATARVLEKARENPNYRHPSLLQDDRAVLPEGALELSGASCGSALQQATTVVAPVQRCYHIPKLYEQAFRQLEAKLVSLGYNEKHHLTETGLIMSRWQEVKEPRRQVVVILTAAAAPPGSSTLTLIDHAALQKTTAPAGNFPVEKKPRETYAEGLSRVLEQRRKSAGSHSLGQETRVLLPRGAVALPSDVCEQALRQTTYVEAPLLGCYHFPQTFTQVRQQLKVKLAALGYHEGFVDEAYGFNTTNWWRTEITEPVLGTVNAYSEALGGSLLFELDYRKAQ